MARCLWSGAARHRTSWTPCPGRAISFIQYFDCSTNPANEIQAIERESLCSLTNSAASSAALKPDHPMFFPLRFLLLSTLLFITAFLHANAATGHVLSVSGTRF